ncbi:arginase family protein [Pseudochelatococcus sp. B33]
MTRSITIIRAPSNLGLRPLRPGHEPGTWRAPEALEQAGLDAALAPARTVSLKRPVYDTEPQPGTRLRNGMGIRTFNLGLADTIATALAAGEFPVVVGGDCSILLGALAGARRVGPHSLVHIDGHSDFRHPGNYDAAATLGAVAGMDLALTTGRGETLLIDWPGAPAPLVPDEQVVQIGEREGRDADFAWPDVNDTAITRIDVFTARKLGAAGIIERTRATLDQTGWPFWVHFDVDVLDQTIMPAVDTPGSPGIDPADLILLLRHLVEDQRCTGLDVTIFDPDLDPDGSLARFLVALLREVFS